MTIPTLTPSRDLDARIMGLLGLTMSMVLEVPRYSTDMNAAVELLAYKATVYKNDLGWCCSFEEETGFWFDPMLPMAICKAFIAKKEYWGNDR